MSEKRCGYCGASGEDVEFHKDHLIPQSRGGSDLLENCVSACKRCNTEKSDRTPSEWRNDLPALIYVREIKLAKKYQMKPRGSRGKKATMELKKPSLNLKGKFFLIYEKEPDPETGRRVIKHYGQIRTEPVDGFCRIYLFSWIIPQSVVNDRVVPVSETVGWEFYDDIDDLYHDYKIYCLHRDRAERRKEKEQERENGAAS